MISISAAARAAYGCAPKGDRGRPASSLLVVLTARQTWATARLTWRRIERCRLRAAGAQRI